MTKLEKLVAEYVMLRDHNQAIRRARRKFMQSYRCTAPSAEDNSPCIHQRLNPDPEMFCDDCKQRHKFYLMLRSNAHRRGVLMKQIHKEVLVRGLRSKLQGQAA